MSEPASPLQTIKEVVVENKNGIPMIGEGAEDRAFREHTGEISKFPEWDAMNSDEYTEEDRKIDDAIDRAVKLFDCGRDDD